VRNFEPFPADKHENSATTMNLCPRNAPVAAGYNGSKRNAIECAVASAVYGLHWPPLHVSPPVHGLLQPPQCVLLFVRSTQTPLLSQSGRDSMHVHAELLQTAPAWHLIPQSEQFSRSDVMSTQLLPASPAPVQSFVGATQVQPPSSHCLPPVHSVLHAPQLDSSVVVFTQANAQFVVPFVHVVPHAPALHT
jgi:hypothetical protein